MIKAEDNFIELKKKVDTTLKIVKIVTTVCSIVLIGVFILNMYFNWLYRGPWDDSMLRSISLYALLVDIPCLFVSGMLEYKIKK